MASSPPEPADGRELEEQAKYDFSGLTVVGQQKRHLVGKKYAATIPKISPYRDPA